MAKRNKIPKNRPMSQMFEKAESDEKELTMEEIIAKMDEKEEKQDKINFRKRIKNMERRKDAITADDKRKSTYLKAASKIENKDQEQR